MLAQQVHEDGVELGTAHDVGRIGARADDGGLAAAGGEDDLGAMRHDEVLDALGCGQTDHSGSRAHGRRRGQDGGSRVGPAAGPQADDPASVLMVRITGNAQEAPELGVGGA